jgi:hypothetical protein
VFASLRIQAMWPDETIVWPAVVFLLHLIPFGTDVVSEMSSWDWPCSDYYLLSGIIPPSSPRLNFHFYAVLPKQVSIPLLPLGEPIICYML